ncbi:cation:proton antiporter family protein [Microbacterium hydrocarbonoxydans]|uniref:cation:proton antiporter family protein n=1 Tax=Microbacterium hydrocarbonoxydans TaxID=273678 RepID=UPI0007BB11E6|nr:cation:proton antiporter family protein [Microbacterium hydrocarbonoxydans]GAT72546.1 putative solute/hydrogen antiporter [Microbacterium sp. HM58-2]
MDVIALTLIVAAAFGTIAHLLRVPALVGFLAAGFVLGAMHVEPFTGLERIAEIGVTLLLFTIGLKFDIRALLRPEAYGTTAIHMVLSVLVGAGLVGLAGVIGLTSVDGWRTLALVGFALSFSSTVLCVKVLEDRSDDGSLYGQTAIAILVIQDVAAVVFITVNGDEPPSPWAFALVLLIPLAWVLRKLLNVIGHGELLVLFGVVMALGPGYLAFEAVGIKGDLGALVMGLLFATHPRAIEMSKALFSVKELFLIGFFLLIGMGASPTWADAGLALLLCVILLPLTFIGYVWLGRLFGLRNRTAIRTGLVLSNFSEFSIIVAAVGVSAGLLTGRWLTVVAIAVALSMVASSVANAHGLRLITALTWLPAQEVSKLRPADRPIDTSGSDVVVLGMGRVGRAAYDRLVEEGGLRVLGIDNDHAVIMRHEADGLNVLEGDATDIEFWSRLVSGGFVKTVVLAMAFHGSNTFALERLHEAGFDGRVVAVAQHPDQVEHLAESGVDGVVNIYAGAGHTLAGLAMEADDDQPSGDGAR